MFRATLKVIGKLCLVTFDNLLGIPVYLFTFLLLRPWRNVVPKLYWTFESYIFRELMYTVAHWSWLGGVKIIEYGDDPESYITERCLVIANHQSTADVPVMMAAMCRKFPGGGQLMWVLDKMFKWTNIGVVSQLHGDFFIEQGRERRKMQSDLLKSHLQRKYWSRGRNWIIIFPEGGFLYKRLEASQEFAQKHNYPVLDRVTLPRIGAIKSVMETCRSYRADEFEFDGQVKYLIDITIIYPKDARPPSLWNLIVGTKELADEIRIVYKVIPADELPIEEETMLDYMYNLWEEKETLLDYFYNNQGQLPKEYEGRGRQLHFSYFSIFFHRVFFVFLGCVYFRMFSHILSYFY